MGHAAILQRFYEKALEKCALKISSWPAESSLLHQDSSAQSSNILRSSRTTATHPLTDACECSRQPCRLVGGCRYQKVGNDLTPKRPIYKFSEFTHLISQLDHACTRRGLCSPDEFGRPFGIRKIVAVGAPMQTRPQTASLIAYEFGEF
jgi:hypothetical protein